MSFPALLRAKAEALTLCSHWLTLVNNKKKSPQDLPARKSRSVAGSTLVSFVQPCAKHARKGAKTTLQDFVALVRLSAPLKAVLIEYESRRGTL
jgi:hypothetical protein